MQYTSFGAERTSGLLVCAGRLPRVPESAGGAPRRADSLALRQQHIGHAAYADLVQEGRIAVWHAILRFDVTRGVAFSSFAFVAIRRQIWRAVVLADRGWIGLAAPEPWDPAAEVEAAWFWTALRAAVAAAVAQLPVRLRQVVTAYYGLDGQAARSFRWIGQVHGIAASGRANCATRPWCCCACRRSPRGCVNCRTYDTRQAYRRTLALSRGWRRRRRPGRQSRTRPGRGRRCADARPADPRPRRQPGAHRAAPLDTPFQSLVSLSRAQLATTREVPAAQRRLLTKHGPGVSLGHGATAPALPPARTGGGTGVAAPPLPFPLCLAAARCGAFRRRPGGVGRLRSRAAPV